MTVRHQIVAISGPIATGKTTIAKGLAARLEWRTFSLSQTIRKIAMDRGSPLTRSSLSLIGLELLARGSDTFVQLVLDDIGWTPGMPFLVDGVRQQAVYNAITLAVSPLPTCLIYVEASFSVRAKRAMARDQITAAELREVDEHPLEQELAALRSTADLVLNADNDVGHLTDLALEWLGNILR
jgi:dephospho-CoA kinase